jgi:hypothetical protein
VEKSGLSAESCNSGRKQRARFAYVVAAAKYFVGRVFNPYYDKFLSKVSGFNRFCSNNIPKSPTYTAIPNFLVTDGPLYPGSALVALYTTGTGAFVLGWGVELGVDGLDTDVAIGWVRNRVTNVTTFGTDGTRVDGTMNVAIAAGQTATDYDCGVFFARVSASLVLKISRNLSCTGAAA